MNNYPNKSSIKAYKDHNEVNTSNNYQLKISVNHQVNSLMDGGLINDK